MKKSLRRLSLSIALIQLLSSTGISVLKDKESRTLTPGSSIELKDNDFNSINNNLFVDDTDPEHIRCFRIDNETGERRNISIFDEENIPSRQYGASQLVFRRKFNALIADPLIFEEMQNYFPVSDFSSTEEAMYFYERYFDLIYNRGCGYVAAADYVFHKYEGREEEFFNTFGFPMYTVNEGKDIDFNYELFVLKFFNYSIIQIGESKERIINSMLKDLYNFQLQELINSSEYKRKLPDDFTNWTKEQWDDWHRFDEERNRKFHSLYDKWTHAENNYVEVAIPLTASFGYFYAFLQQYGISSNITYKEIVTNFSVDDIVASDNFKLYKIEEEDVLENVRSHYIYIVGVTEDNKTIVSSWGERYVFDNSHANWTEKILIKTN